jgi:Xaa-Pro aminopeptidase
MTAMLATPMAAEYAAAVDLGRDLLVDLPSQITSPRIDRLRAALSQREEPVDALLITDLINIRYLTGFTGSSARLLVTLDDAVLVTDSRYAERSAEELTAARSNARIAIERTQKAQDEFLLETLRSCSVKTLGLEADHITWAQHGAYETNFNEVCVLIATTSVVGDLRRVKDVGEVARLARASAIADAALMSVVELLRTPITEIDFARALEAAMDDAGSHGVSFESIIASGPNASRPHHDPSRRLIVKGDEVICDFGATINGYHSDMTRTIYVGEPSKAQQRHFAVVHEAQRAGIAAVGIGAEGSAVDAAARDVIGAAGWAEFFGHGLGHGSGLLIHESPWLGPTSTSTLANGDIVTVEPGVYLPGVGGVRIEDSMVVTENGPILMTRCRYDLVVG